MFSPSQTRTYSRCQYKWFLSKFLGITEAYIGKRDLAACVGTAVGAALQASTRSSFTESELIQQAQSRYVMELAEKMKMGRSVLECEEAEVYPSLIPGMVKAFMKEEPIPPDWNVLAAEAPISDDYEAYIDLAGTCDRGLFIADVKCRMNEKAGYVRNSLLKYQFDQQLCQYAYEWQRKNPDTPLEFYRIIYIVGSPTPICTWQDFEIDWDFLNKRMQSDYTVWNRMANQRKMLDALAVEHGGYSKIPPQILYQVVPMASDHMDGFYKCDMWDPCLTYGGRVHQVPGLISIERKVPSGTTDQTV